MSNRTNGRGTYKVVAIEMVPMTRRGAWTPQERLLENNDILLPARTSLPDSTLPAGVAHSSLFNLIEPSAISEHVDARRDHMVVLGMRGRM